MSHYYLLDLNLTALGIYKNLQKKGFVLHLFHNNSKLINFIDSNQADIHFHRYSLGDEPETLLNQLIDIQRKLSDPGIIFAASDADVAFIDRYREELGNNSFILSIPSSEITPLVNDKHAFSNKLTGLGINTPESICIDPRAFQSVKDKISFPSLIKPVFSSEWKSKCVSEILGGKKAFVLRNHKDLIDTIPKLFEFSSQLLIQEIIDVPENGNFSFCCYSDDDGNMIHGFVTQKLLQYPEGFGTSLFCRVAERPDIFEFGKKTIKALGLGGISETEIVVDKNTNQLFVIEVNTRHWMQHRLSTRIGMNYSLLDFYYRTGNDVKVRELLKNAPNTYQHVIWFDDVGYLIYMVKHLFHPRKCRFREIFQNKWEFSLFSLSDWQPFVKSLRQKLTG